MHKALGAQPFNYTDAIDALPNSVLAFGSLAQTSSTITDGLFTDAAPFDVSGSAVTATTVGGGAGARGSISAQNGAASGATNGVSDAGVFVLAETALNMHCWGENPVVTAKLQLNGQDRFSEREGTYFDLVQPYQHHTRNPDTGINCYSFALRPEEHQPSGTCNFSRIDNAKLDTNVALTTDDNIYAVNYNVLRIMSGMGGLAYSN